ncbi:MAG: hypothetical protein U5R31_03710 [Acidimicrobiia bacterium]|nr:hypothetical protein [Acidimicrobiia bacterium]
MTTELSGSISMSSDAGGPARPGTVVEVTVPYASLLDDRFVP